MRKIAIKLIWLLLIVIYSQPLFAQETVSIPTTPTGSTSGNVNQSLSFSTGGSVSSLEHPVEYQFDWGDGSLSVWGAETQSHTYTSAGTHTVKAKARCQIDTGIESGWSPGLNVVVSGHTLTVSVTGSGTVSKSPDKTEYDHNESVTLTPNPGTDYEFDHWEGSLTGSSDPGVLTMDANKSVTAVFTAIPETVSTPTTPAGPTTGAVGSSLSYSTGGSVSNLGHIVEYRFDWGNGSFSAWGSSSQSYTYTNVGSYSVKAQARCATHTTIVSAWSSGITVNVSGHTLTVSVTGSGTVTKSPDKTGYNHNESVTLTPNPGTEYQFDHWEGSLTGSSNPGVLTMDANKSVTAVFTAIPETVSKPTTPTGPASGSVNQSLTYSTGGAVSNLGHTVQYQFTWGDGSTSTWGSSTQSHTYTAAGNHTITAQARCVTHPAVVSSLSSGLIVDISGYTLTVSVTGTGTVTKSPDKTEYDHNESVSLTPNPGTDYQFDHWEGSLTGSSNPGVLTMTANKSVTAVFTAIPETVTAPATPAGPASGSVNQSLTYSTGGSVSNLGHTVEYQFTWGDGSTSTWGSSTQSHTYTAAGNHTITAQARCVTHPAVVSSLSSGMVVNITGYTLTVSVTGTGSVTRIPDKTEYNYNESVSLIPNPGSGYQFDHWEGALTGSANPGTLIMTGNKTVTAVFAEVPETVSTPTAPAGPSSGVVGQSLSYNTSGSVSNLGHTIEYRFDWGDGNISTWGASSRSYTFNLTGNYSVRAQARCATHTAITSAWSSGISVNVSGHSLSVSVTGSGSVAKNPDKSGYNHNESVTLTPSAAMYYQFNHWEGDLTGSTSPGVLTMNADKSVTAVFTEIPEVISTPTTPAGPVSGKVGQSLSYSTGGSASNLDHSVEYRFDWGDGNLSAWGVASRTHTYSNVGSYVVKSQARCQTHTSIVSAWSTGITAAVSGYTLTITVSGSGSVTKSPDKTGYNQNESVTLTPNPGTYYQFNHWEGNLTGSTNPGVLTMNGDKSVTAVFTEIPETVSIPTTPAGPSSGEVGESLGYTTGGSTSNLGHTVEYRFDYGDGTISTWGTPSGTHVYTQTGNYEVLAQARCATHTTILSAWSIVKNVTIYGHTLGISVTGSGSVTRTPNKSGYDHNELVTLTPNPGTYYQFDHWEGDLTGNDNPGILTMNGDKSVTVIFTEIAETVSAPSTPTGPSSGEVGDNLTFSTGGSSSNLDHTVEYRFNWGDGNFSNWGASSQSHGYIQTGSYTVRAQARCAVHTGVLSTWSAGKVVNVTGHSLDISITGTGNVTQNPDKFLYNHNESVTLTPNAGQYYQFNHWEGDLTGSANPAVLVMNGDKSLTAVFTEIPETISTPSVPSGPVSAHVGQGLGYTTGGSTSNLDHTVEYRFDWGDGNLSTWGALSRSHTYSNVGDYTVCAQARCQTHTTILSAWSSGISVTLSGHMLTLSITGSGSVTRIPDKYEYNHNENVSLTPVPGTYYQFDHWEKDLSGSIQPATLSMNGNKEVTAVFTEIPEIVTVPSVPSGPLNCKVNESINFLSGASESNLDHAVEYRFDWGNGDYSSWGSANRDYVYIQVGQFTVRAQARCQTHTDKVSNWSDGASITVTGHSLGISMIGSGMVKKNPDKVTYDHNEVVTLIPDAWSGWQFDHWEGDLTNNHNPGLISMNGDKNIIAVFTVTIETISQPSAPYGPSSGEVGQSFGYSTGGSLSNLGHTVEYRFDWGDGNYSDWGPSNQSHSYSKVNIYSIRAQARCQIDSGVVSAWSSEKIMTVTGFTLSLSIVGSGSLTKNADKIEYNRGESVTLIPNPETGYQFDHWTGDLTGSLNPGTILMDGDKQVTAVFIKSDEFISTPAIPTGSSSGKVGWSLGYSTGGATSSLSHAVEYRFDWGDGNISDWGPASQSYSFSRVNTYDIKAQARCQIHNEFMSAWSGGLGVTISGHLLNLFVTGTGTVTKLPDKGEYNQEEMITLTPVSGTGFQFDHWEGDLTGYTSPGQLTMDRDKSVMAVFIQSTEIVSVPDIPAGSQTGKVGTDISYATGGAESNLAHPVEYRFDWGDGIFSSWGSSDQIHQYASIGKYTIRAQARCETDTVVLSIWSSGTDITISGFTLTVAVSGSGNVIISPEKTGYNLHEIVFLLPDPQTGWWFDHWEGNLTGNSYPKSLIMNTDMAVTAVFKQEDDQPPSISNLSSQINQNNNQITITSNISDNIALMNATLYYRKGGSTSFLSVLMTQGSSSYEGIIPDDVISERGIEYYVQAVDSSGNSTTHPPVNPTTAPHILQIVFASLNCPYTTPVNSYRMISVPAILDDSTPTAVLTDNLGVLDRAEWRLLRGQNGVYAEYGIDEVANFEPGNAFWLITRKAKTWDAGSGKSLSTGQKAVITLTPGWNQIGNPFAFQVAWNNVVSNGNIEAPVGYEGTEADTIAGYRYNQSVLSPWKGYCIKNLESFDVTLEIPPVEASGVTKVNWISSKQDWVVQINARCGKSNDNDNYFGCLKNASIIWDSNDFSEAPPIGDFISLYFPHDDWEQYPGKYTGDFRPLIQSGERWDVTVRTNISRSEIVLDFQNIGSIPQEFSAVVIDLQTRVSTDLRLNSSLVLNTGSGESERHLQILVGDPRFIEENLKAVAQLPTTLHLDHCYPNPFNASTNIRYYLPEQSEVTLTVFDLLGKKVMDIEKKTALAQGYHTVVWEAKNSDGVPVSSGIYIVYIKAGKWTRQRKIVFTK
jgi:methionine-rich copper-binding protein CopC